MSTLAILSVVLAVVVIAAVALALILVRRALESTAATLGTLGQALQDVESGHLRGLERSVRAINAQFDEILSVLPGVAEKAKTVAARRPS
jgi:uncharacterized membrane protein